MGEAGDGLSLLLFFPLAHFYGDFLFFLPVPGGGGSQSERSAWLTAPETDSKIVA